MDYRWAWIRNNHALDIQSLLRFHNACLIVNTVSENDKVKAYSLWVFFLSEFSFQSQWAIAKKKTKSESVFTLEIDDKNSSNLPGTASKKAKREIIIKIPKIFILAVQITLSDWLLLWNICKEKFFRWNSLTTGWQKIFEKASESFWKLIWSKIFGSVTKCRSLLSTL